ncbi:unnamed protein product, partial [Iphiclides podalirius]
MNVLLQYSDGCGSGRSSPRERWPERWRRDERNYGSLGWRESRRRQEMRQSEDPNDRRYGSTLGWPGRRSTTSASRRDADRDSRDSAVTRATQAVTRATLAATRAVTRATRVTPATHSRDSRRRSRRDDRPRRDYRFSNDFSPRERDHTSPFENDFQDTPTLGGKKRTPYSTLEGARFAFEPEDVAASPASASRDADSPAARSRFDSDSVSPRSAFEDDFAATAPHRAASIAEEEEDEGPLPLRARPPLAPPPQRRDIKKSDSVNIFTRGSDPFEGDAFFACTGSDRAARRDNWPGDFRGFDNA